MRRSDFCYAPLGGAIRSLAALLLISVACSSATTEQRPVTANRPSPLLGINLLWANSWYPSVPFANVFLSSRKPTVINDWNTLVAVDAAGDPTADFSTVVFEGTAMSGFSGTYQLRFRGQADVTGSGMDISGLNYDAATNVTTAALEIDASQNINIFFANTRRNPGDTIATGLTELTLMAPGTSAEGDVLAPYFLTAIKPFGILRPMQALNPKNPIRNWAERTRPGGIGATGDSPGMAFEYLVLMANASDRDIWVNVPYYLDGDGQICLAQLLEYGSDGDQPYTGPFGSQVSAANPYPATHDPATWTPATRDWYPPLRQGLHAYIELSNEIWNYYPDYWGNQLAEDAYNEYQGGDLYHYSVLNPGDPENRGYLRLGRHGRLHKELAERFLAVVGDVNYGDRYRMVLASQIDWDDVLRGPLTYLATIYGGHKNNGASLGELLIPEDGRLNSYGNPAWPVSRYVHYLSGAPYVSGATAAAQAVQLETTIKGLIDRLYQFADDFGVKVIAYEGGVEKEAGYSDPGSTQVIVDELHYWYEKDPNAPFVYFGLVDNDGAGLSPTIFDLDVNVWPKWRAIHQIATELEVP